MAPPYEAELISSTMDIWSREASSAALMVVNVQVMVEAKLRSAPVVSSYDTLIRYDVHQAVLASASVLVKDIKYSESTK